MDARTLLGRSCFAVVTVGLMFYIYEYSVTQAVRTAVSSQSQAPKLASGPSSDLSGCGINTDAFGTSSYGQPGYVASSRCNFDSPPAAPKPKPSPAPAPIPQVTKTESTTANLWFIAAALALPLGLGGAMALVFRVVRDR